MSFIPGKPYICWRHLEAKTPEELEILMLKISIRAPYICTFSQPSYSEKKWHVWYMFDWSLEIKGKDKFKVESEGET